MSKSIIAEKAFQFSLKIVKFHLHLCKREQNLYSISKQLLRSGTSICANVEEAIGGHSEKDFSAKMSIAYKEARESKYWLRLLTEGGLIDKRETEYLLIDLEEIIKISGSIIRTIKQKHSRLQTPNSRLT